jgi:hypothetical protein
MADTVTWKNATGKQRVRGLILFLALFCLVFAVHSGWTKMSSLFADKVDMSQLSGVKWDCDIEGDGEGKQWVQFNRDRQTVYWVTDVAHNPQAYLIGRFGADAGTHAVKAAFTSIYLGNGLGYDSIVRLSHPPGYGRLEWDLTVTKADNGQLKFSGNETVVRDVSAGVQQHPISAKCSAA